MIKTLKKLVESCQNCTLRVYYDKESQNIVSDSANIKFSEDENIIAIKDGNDTSILNLNVIKRIDFIPTLKNKD